MNNRLHAAILLLIFAAVISAACSGNNEQRQHQQEETNRPADEHAAHAEMQMDSAKPTDESIYNVSSVWQNRHGYRVQLDSLRGKVQVVAMVYTHCEYACPRILADMKRIRDSLSDGARDQTNFVIISIDPERDTPERLLKFANENELREDRWTLLHGTQGDILEMAALLGVKYKRVSESDFTHSNIITVLNREGEIVHQRKKLTDQQLVTVSKIEELVSD